MTSHDECILNRIASLEKKGAVVFWADVPGISRPDLMYMKDGEIIGEDIKPVKVPRTGASVDYTYSYRVQVEMKVPKEAIQ